jgi:PAS domain S-box-containing protein
MGDTSPEQAQTAGTPGPLKNVLDSAGTLVVTLGHNGTLTYMNPAAEHMLGYHAPELLNQPISFLLSPEEELRLLAELQKLCGIGRTLVPSGEERFAAMMECLKRLPPSQVPSFDSKLRRKDDADLPVRLHVSALRDEQGEPTGLVMVSMRQGLGARPELGQRDSTDRFRSLFEDSTEMIATLNPEGRFLYANPTWKRCFGLDREALNGLSSFDQVFAPSCQAEAATLLRKALAGETIDRAPLRYYTAEGQALELELSLNPRRKAGRPITVRCLLRDVTQQKRREHRMALQLLVSQIVGENSPPDSMGVRVLEALCVSQGWDLAVQWDVSADQSRLEFNSAWAPPGRPAEVLIQESMGQTLLPGMSLPGQVWKEGRPIWASDLAALRDDPRAQAALDHQMLSAWAVPVRVGNTVLAVLEFYSHIKLREDHETIAAVEMVAGSLGQMLARTRERGRAEELSRQQEILLDSVADGIFGVDRNGLVRFANPAAVRLLGAPAASMIGRPVHELLHGAAPATSQCGEDCALRYASTHRRSWTGEDTVYRGDGTTFPAECFLNPILDEGHFSGSVLSLRDISQRYALDRMKDEFVSTVSHELRTPLTSIRGALGLLSSGMLGQISDKASNLLRIALSNSNRLVRLINDILTLERTQSGREPLVLRPVQMSEIVRQAIDGMQVVAEEASVLLVSDKTQVEVVADPDRLLQVLTNLLSNAIKFSPPNSAVSVVMRPSAGGVTLSIIDQGRGIPPDKLEVIFGRFQQVDATDSRLKGGSGLGLAICSAIVLQHNGRIWAERNPVRGSTFRVFLPYDPTTAAKTRGGDTSTPGRGLILLAGANGAARPILAGQLADHGYRVMEASTVEQTLSAAHDGVEAIILDAAPEGVNAWEVLPLLRRVGPEAHTPVVLLHVDHQPNVPAKPSDGNGSMRKEKSFLRDLGRALGGTGELARILVVARNAEQALAIGEAFSLENTTVKLTHDSQAAQDAFLAFLPHLLVLDIALPGGNGFRVVNWLREHEHLARTPLVVYSSRDLEKNLPNHHALEPARLVSSARVQPRQLEALVLTILRGSGQIEETLSEV